MIDIKKTLRDGFKLPETILNEYTERIKNIYVSNHQEQDGFGILAELIQLKLEIRRIGIKIHGEIESKNLHINDVINKLKIDIEAAEDDTGKKIYSNDAKRKIELDTRVAADQSLTGLRSRIDSGKLLTTELDLAESILRSLTAFLEKK